MTRFTADSTTPPINMTLYQDEKKYLEALKQKVADKKSVTQEELLELLDKFEDMVEMSSVSFRIIDRLMMNYDKLKSQFSEKVTKLEN